MRWGLGLVAGALLVACGTHKNDSASGPSSRGAPGVGVGGVSGVSGATGVVDTGDASSQPVRCEGGSITFKLRVAPDSATEYSVAPGNAYCGSWGNYWLSIRPAGYEPSRPDDHTHDFGPLSVTNFTCYRACDSTCHPFACEGPCFAAQTIGTDGVTDFFDGRYKAFTYCGGGGCYDVACAPSGDYIATLCGYPGTGGGPNDVGHFSQTPICIEVPFTWPPQVSGQVIERTIGNPLRDAGDSDAH
jgi:hypothetical protein